MNFQPNDFDIFRSLERHFHLVRQATETLRLGTEGALEAPTAFAKVQKLERDGDESLRSAIRQLDRQIIDYPPREDIHRIFYCQDRILDAAKNLAGCVAAYHLDVLPDAALRLAMIVECCADVLAEALQSFGEAQGLGNQIGKMLDLENEADQLRIMAICNLFENESDQRRLFMLEELYGKFEKLIDLFGDCIQAMEDMSLKHAPGG